MLLLINLLNRKIRVHRAKIDSEKIIGLKYGTLLEIVEGDIHEISEEQFQNLAFDGILDEGQANESSAGSCDVRGDNRNLVDEQQNQKLKEEEIKSLKETGFRGREVVSFLVENSATFQNKTVFSKEKYLKRKHKKHRIIIRLLKPNLPLVIEWQCQRGRRAVGGLSIENLSQIPNYANISHGSRAIVFDNCGGLVLLSIQQRLGGSGKIIDLHLSSQPTRNVFRKIFDSLGFPQHFNQQVVESFPLKYTELLSKDEFADGEDEPVVDDPSQLKPEEVAKIERRKQRIDRLTGTWKLIKQGNFDAYVVCWPFISMQFF